MDRSVVDNGAQAQPPSGAHDIPEGYEDLVLIEQGGFATVYRAHDIRFDRTVALKILRAERLGERQQRRFRAECLATGRVSSHPNIVTVYEAGTTRGNRPWLAMEYCSGGSLARKVAAHGPLSVADVISIGARLSSALHAAHEAGILHRDVKPHNVLITSYGEPALADFGIASVLNVDDTGSIATETAAYTVVHAAPEILEGKAGTAAADIYSLGSTLYTLLAGKAPFATEASIGLAPLVARIMGGDLPAISRPGVPPELEQLLRKCMAAEPRDRPASAVELSASLAELGNLLGVALAPLGQQLAAEEVDKQALVPAPTAPPVSSRRLLFILGCALGVLLAAFTTWGLTHRAAEPDRLSPSAVTANSSPAAAKYTPKNVVVAQGSGKRELIVSWTMPIRPDVVATVIYQGTGPARARAVVNYNTSPKAVAQATMLGLPSGQQVCLSVAHLVSLDGSVTGALSPPMCAAPR